MAWPDLPESIELLESNYVLANTRRADAQAQIDWAWVDWNAGDDHAALVNVLQGMQKHNDALEAIINYALPLTPKNLLPTILYQMRTEYGAAAYELTMTKLINCMFTASFEELRSFVGLVDAYRQSLWNKPFDVELWAAIARGFEQWA